MTSKRTITTRDIAEAAGVAQSTVSRALRNDHHIAESQRERIRKLAKEMGYRPNPFVTAFTTQVMHHRRSPQRPVIACVNASIGKTLTTYFHEYWRGAETRANEMGFKLDLFHLADLGNSLTRLASVLRARGISGVLFMPTFSRVDYSEFPFDEFACAAVDPTFHEPWICRAEPYYYQSMQLAYDTLKERGYRRIAFATTWKEIKYLGDEWLGAYLARQAILPQKDRLPAFIAITRGHEAGEIPQDLPKSRSQPPFMPWDPKVFKNWLEVHHPDALISNYNNFFEWAKESKRQPPDFACATLGIDKTHDDMAGIDQNRELVGAYAIDNIMAKIFRNDYGLVKHPRTIMISGIWKDSPTVRSAPLTPQTVPPKKN